MYVINLIKDGKLNQTSVVFEEKDALAIARSWTKDLKDSEGYVAIDKKAGKNGEFIRHSELSLNGGNAKIEIKLQETDLSGKLSMPPIFKDYAFTFLELALQSLLQFLKSQNKAKK